MLTSFSQDYVCENHLFFFITVHSHCCETFHCMNKLIFFTVNMYWFLTVTKWCCYDHSSMCLSIHIITYLSAVGGLGHR